MQKYILAAPLPSELLGAYDVVHLRLFNTALPDGNLDPVLRVAMEMLKPGGFLQWEETRGDRFIAEVPPEPWPYLLSPSSSLDGRGEKRGEGKTTAKTTATATETLLEILHRGAEAKGISNGWVEGLDARLAGFGFAMIGLLWVWLAGMDKPRNHRT